MIMGMSEDRNCEEYWRDIARDFLYKGGITNLGTAIMTRYEQILSWDPREITVCSTTKEYNT